MKKNIVKALSALVAISLLTFAGCKQGVAQDEVDALKTKVAKFERMAEYQGLRAMKGLRAALTAELNNFKKGGSEAYMGDGKPYTTWMQSADTTDKMDEPNKALVTKGTAAAKEDGYKKLKAVEDCFTELKKSYVNAVDKGYGIRLLYKEADGTVAAVLDTDPSFKTLKEAAEDVIGKDTATAKTVREFVESNKGAGALKEYADELQLYLEAINTSIKLAEAAIVDRQDVHKKIIMAGLKDKVGGLHRKISNDAELKSAVEAAEAAVKAADTRFAELEKEFN